MLQGSGRVAFQLSRMLEETKVVKTCTNAYIRSFSHLGSLFLFGKYGKLQDTLCTPSTKKIRI